MTLEELIGQRLVLGIEGSQVTPETVELFRKTRAGGLIVFERNFESPERLRRLISDLEQILGRQLLVMVDHEGGRVIRFREGVTIFPDAQAAGVCGDVDLVRRQGEKEAEELRSLGIDLNLAPALDVLGLSWNPAIGTRSYGHDPQGVAAMGRARIKGMQSKGLSACAKHYPGLGEAELDPHFELPVIRKNWKAMRQTHLLPFLKAFEENVEGVMSSHVIYPELESDSRRPATFSRRIIHDSLRLEFGFTGVILSDDLKMDAIAKKVPLREAAPLTVKAGHDLLLICSDAQAQQEVFDGLLGAHKKKDLKISELESSVERILHLKEKHQPRLLKDFSSSKEDGKELARLLASRGAKILRDGGGLLPISPAWCVKHSVSVLFPDLSSIVRERFIETELLEGRDFIRRTFSQFGVPAPNFQMISVDPDEKERSKIKAMAQEQDLAFFFCWDAHLFGGTRQLLEELQGTAKCLVVILLREPRDLEWLRLEFACVTGYGSRICQIEAALRKIFLPR